MFHSLQPQSPGVGLINLLGLVVNIAASVPALFISAEHQTMNTGLHSYTHLFCGDWSQTRHSSSDHSLLLYVSYNSLHLPTLSMEWHYWKPLSAIYSYNLFLRYNAPFYYYPSLLGARIRWIICSHLPELCKSALLFSHGNFAEPFSSILPTCPLDTGGCASVPYLLDKLDSWRSSKLPFSWPKLVLSKEWIILFCRTENLHKTKRQLDLCIIPEFINIWPEETLETWKCKSHFLLDTLYLTSPTFSSHSSWT